MPLGTQVACKFVGNDASAIHWANVIVPVGSVDWGSEGISIGSTILSTDTKLDVTTNNSNQDVGIVSEVDCTEDWNFGIISAVSREKTKAFSVYREVSENNYADTFAVLGNGILCATENSL